jgi:ATP-dependent DNA helicase RecG
VPESSSPFLLTTPLAEIRAITDRQVALLKPMGITRLGHLIAHLPSRHEQIEAETPLGDLVAGQLVSARGTITATRPVRAGKLPRLELAVLDETGRLDVVIFNAPRWRIEQLHPGTRVRVTGTPKTRGPGLQMANPKIDVLKEGTEDPELQGARVRPVYPATEDLKSFEIEKVIQKVLDAALPLLEDHLPEDFRSQRGLPSLAEAYRMQHRPESLEETKQSRRRLAYDELLMLQVGVHIKRAHLRKTLKAPALKFNAAIDKHIRERLPFALTPGQEDVVKDIAKDLSTPTPTNRLIQGDVGSGKTLVALYAMLLAVASQRQASLMAPTELLAEQHFASISRMLEGSRVKVELLTGSTPKPERDSLLKRLADGELDILIGTHALLTESVQFKSLALAVIDEQHRFGVHQRSKLREKATGEASTPHVLVMTATPIPRTMAITLFGDLDISSIHGLPPGRTPIKTKVVPPEHRELAYAEIEQRLARSEQAYYVVPAIDPTHQDEGDYMPAAVGVGGETAAAPAPLRDVRTAMRDLEARFPKARIAAVHGQLSRASREPVMERFRSGKINILVATTVIEVGVDVPNATLMVVDNADRFGLAQLHQLRGRVGRGSKESACYLISGESTAPTPESSARLAILENVTDGFALAEKDLELRGPGEMFGARQSGLPPFKVADLMRDRELLSMAKRDAAAWVTASPAMNQPHDQLLFRRLVKAFGKELGLADVG